MAVSDTRLQRLLAQSEIFTSRVLITLCKIAGQVLTETGVGATHAARATYARAVLANPDQATRSASIFLAQSTNVAGTITMEDEGPRSSVSDAALESQVASAWNVLAGVDTGN